jgi:hypothetical protein
MPTGIYLRTEEHSRKISEANKGRRFSLEHRMKLGMAQIGNKKYLGKKWTEEHKKLMSERQQDEKGTNWKGDDVGYRALHGWVQKHLGKPTKCEFCKLEFNNSRQIHWANKSHEYKRDLSDWLRLCVSCHKQYDLSLKKRELYVEETA